MTQLAPAEPVDLAALTLDSFAGRPVAVLGLARSGIALCRFLADRGARVTVYDLRPAGELADAVAALEGRSVRTLLGPTIDPADALAGQALVATSPSVSSRYPTTEPRLRAALAALETEGRVPVVSEIDLFLRLCPGTTIGVTGTKGKTTTSSLCAAILATAPEPVLLGGNIGVPLVERLPELTSAHRIVLELSELQLPTLSRGTHLCVYTHVTADHLDRHGDLAAYHAVKRRLAELTPPDGIVVLNDEDPVSREFGSATSARVVRYRRFDPPPGGVGVVDGWLVAAGRGRVMPLSAIPLPGQHSVSNVAAATAVGLELGIAPAAIRQAVERFAGVEHRLETVALHDGVRYVNDSMGTQPDAVIAALRSFEPPLVLIAGGRAKDLAVDELARVVAERVAAVVLIGESGPDLGRAFSQAGLARTTRARDMEDAVVQADAIARELGFGETGEQTATVLLSPAAASFDMFEDYAARGRAFRDAVARVTGQRESAR